MLSANCCLEQDDSGMECRRLDGLLTRRKLACLFGQTWFTRVDGFLAALAVILLDFTSLCREEECNSPYGRGRCGRMATGNR